MGSEGTATSPSPFHSGEIELQRILGVAERMDAFGRKVIRDYMPEQHREFFRHLSFAVIGSADGKGDIWATLLCGDEGFIGSPSPRSLAFSCVLDEEDPATPGLADGAAVGILGIELHTRRRNRMNGTVRRDGHNGFSVEVEHSFGNCPQYIQARRWRYRDVGAEVRPAGAHQLLLLDDEARTMITTADTFFVASGVRLEGGRQQLDVSHRGGKPGFVRVGRSGTLTIPDFSGNFHFNTLGNFLRDRRGGLVFVDFVTGDILQLTGDAEVVLDSPLIREFKGAERLWTFTPRRIVRRRAAFPLRFDFVGMSPTAMETGDWKDDGSMRTVREADRLWRRLRVADVADESSVVRSFHLVGEDGLRLAPFQPGQHLPIRVKLEEGGVPLMRTYTLSSAPGDGAYRISVKREGRVSSYLHDMVGVGDVIEARPPAGSFTIDTSERRPAVLLAAGIGITPILSMARHVVDEGVRTGHARLLTIIYAAKSKGERSFNAELLALSESAAGGMLLLRVLEDVAGAEFGIDYELPGRVGSVLLSSIKGTGDCDFLMCGPPRFMQGVYDELRRLDVPDDRIHAEAFGPASLRRSNLPAMPKIADGPVPVAFARSGKEARWVPGSGTLLELAEAAGLIPDSSCRGGSCGTCAVKIISGSVTYESKPAFRMLDGEALLCCAFPAIKEDGSVGGLVLGV